MPYWYYNSSTAQNPRFSATDPDWPWYSEASSLDARYFSNASSLVLRKSKYVLLFYFMLNWIFTCRDKILIWCSGIYDGISLRKVYRSHWHFSITILMCRLCPPCLLSSTSWNTSCILNYLNFNLNESYNAMRNSIFSRANNKFS